MDRDRCLCIVLRITRRRAARRRICNSNSASRNGLFVEVGRGGTGMFCCTVLFNADVHVRLLED